MSPGAFCGRMRFIGVFVRPGFETKPALCQTSFFAVDMCIEESFSVTSIGQRLKYITYGFIKVVK